MISLRAFWLAEKQFLNGLHGIEEAIWLRRKRDEIVIRIESTRPFVLRVDNDYRRGDFAGISKSALERIQEEQLTDSLPSEVFDDGESPQESSRQVQVAREPLRDTFREISQVHQMGGQRVEPGNGCAIGGDDEGRRYAPTYILTGLPLQIAVQRFHATRKSRTVVLVAERLDSVLSFVVLLVHQAPNCLLWRCAAALMRALGAGGFSKARTNTSRSRPVRTQTSCS